MQNLKVQTLVLQNADTDGSLARMMVAALQHDIAEGVVGKAVEAYNHRMVEEDKTADYIDHVAQPYFEKHNAASLNQNCSRLTLWDHLEPHPGIEQLHPFFEGPWMDNMFSPVKVEVGCCSSAALVVQIGHVIGSAVGI